MSSSRSGYSDQMEALTSSYRSLTFTSLIVGILITVFLTFNSESLSLARYLSEFQLKFVKLFSQLFLPSRPKKLLKVVYQLRSHSWPHYILSCCQMESVPFQSFSSLSDRTLLVKQILLQLVSIPASESLISTISNLKPLKLKWNTTSVPLKNRRRTIWEEVELSMYLQQILMRIGRRIHLSTLNFLFSLVATFCYPLSIFVVELYLSYHVKLQFLPCYYCLKPQYMYAFIFNSKFELNLT